MEEIKKIIIDSFFGVSFDSDKSGTSEYDCMIDDIREINNFVNNFNIKDEVIYNNILPKYEYKIKESYLETANARKVCKSGAVHGGGGIVDENKEIEKHRKLHKKIKSSLDVLDNCKNDFVKFIKNNYKDEYLELEKQKKKETILNQSRCFNDFVKKTENTYKDMPNVIKSHIECNFETLYFNLLSIDKDEAYNFLTNNKDKISKRKYNFIIKKYGVNENE